MKQENFHSLLGRNTQVHEIAISWKNVDPLSARLHGTWRCTKWVGRGREEDENFQTYTFNPDGSAAWRDERMPAWDDANNRLQWRWVIQEGQLWIECKGPVETLVSLHRFEMPDPNTLVLYVTGTTRRYRIFKREICSDATA